MELFLTERVPCRKLCFFIGERDLTEIQVWKDFLCCFRFGCLGYGARSVGGLSPTLISTPLAFSMCLFYCSLLKS